MSQNSRHEAIVKIHSLVTAAGFLLKEVLRERVADSHVVRPIVLVGRVFQMSIISRDVETGKNFEAQYCYF